jgi:hypothetical protein
MNDLTGNSLTEGAVPVFLDYDPDLFVNRDREIKMITDMAQALSRGEEIRNRIVVFWGSKGSGKTWLLRQIADILKEVPDVKSVYLDLGTWADQPAEEAAQALLVRLAEWLWGSDSKQAALSRRATDSWPALVASLLKDDIDSLLQKQVLALLLDHVHESDWHFLEVLEESLLDFLAVQSRVLIVMTGHGQAYLWKTPELRLFVHDYHLKPFDRQGYTEEQIRFQKKEATQRAAEIHRVSRGYPLANILLAAQPTIGQAMEEAVNALLDQVPEEECSWIEALCVLQTFGEEHIPPMLAAHSEDGSISTRPYHQVRAVRDRLLHTRMVRWQEQAGAWAIDEAIRPLLEEYLLQIKPDVWKRLHCAAYRLYAKDWMRKYPNEEERWQEEANYHASRLSEAGHDPEECPNRSK